MSQAASAPDDNLKLAQDVLRQESEAIGQFAERLDSNFLQAAELVLHCRGMVVVTGMGKAGLIGAKISATLASTGTRSHFLHPAEAVHGDLGRIMSEDVVIALSRSGTTEEVLRLLGPLKRSGNKIIAVTASPESPMAKHCDVVIDLGPIDEAGPLGLAPTTSTSVMLAFGDALAMTVMQQRNFSKEEFASFHPAGAPSTSRMPWAMPWAGMRRPIERRFGCCSLFGTSLVARNIKVYGPGVCARINR